jgi:hypothetical protein
VAEAIFAGEQIEEFTQIERCAVLAFIFAEVPGLPKNLFVSDSPRDTCSCKTEKQ